MRRLIYAFVVRIWQKQVFLWRGSDENGLHKMAGYICTVTVVLELAARQTFEIPPMRHLYCSEYIRTGFELSMLMNVRVLFSFVFFFFFFFFFFNFPRMVVGPLNLWCYCWVNVIVTYLLRRFKNLELRAFGLLLWWPLLPMTMATKPLKSIWYRSSVPMVDSVAERTHC